MVVILNCHFTASITYPDSLHGFWAGRSTGTATIEVNLLEKVASIREAALHAIFPYLHKEYYALDRSRCLEILDGYGVGTRALCLLIRYWEGLHMVALTGGYYGEPFCGEIGVTQGDPLLPTIFNVVVDTVVCH